MQEQGHKGVSLKDLASVILPFPRQESKLSYVYVMDFDGDRIRHMTKIWNDGISLKQLGWM